MLFTLLMRDEFIFYKATKISLQCWVGFSSSTAGGSSGASGSESGAALFASKPRLIPLPGWQILPFPSFVTPLALPVCCVANKISQLLENNLCTPKCDSQLQHLAELSTSLGESWRQPVQLHNDC